MNFTFSPNSQVFVPQSFPQPAPTGQNWAHQQHVHPRFPQTTLQKSESFSYTQPQQQEFFAQ